MADTPGTIITLWRDIVALLEGDLEFSTEPKIKVFKANEGSPEEMEKSMTGAAAGAGLVVLVDEPQIQPIDDIRFRVVAQIGVAEDATLSTGAGGTKRRARDIAEHIATLLRDWIPNTREPIDRFRLTAWSIPNEQGGAMHRLTFSAPLLSP